MASSSNKTHTCPQCSIVFGSAGWLTKHMRDAHQVFDSERENLRDADDEEGASRRIFQLAAGVSVTQSESFDRPSPPRPAPGQGRQRGGGAASLQQEPAFAQPQLSTPSAQRKSKKAYISCFSKHYLPLSPIDRDARHVSLRHFRSSPLYLITLHLFPLQPLTLYCGDHS
jgi:hypothetical protein